MARREQDIMSMINRRKFAQLMGGAGLAAASPGFFRSAAIAKGNARVVIVGGGAGGATVARILKSEAPQLAVTLVETQKIYTTCFNSNHYFGGFRTFASLQHSYDGLRKLGITVATDTAFHVDADKRTVALAGGTTIPYDRLVLSPGIAFQWEAIEGYSAQTAELMPHAWTAGPQTLLLMRQLEAMDDGGVVVMAVPDNPYRCPPGPYERACMIAHFLKTKKPKSKLVIFDAKRTFSKQAAFEEAFAKYYDGIIDLNLTNEIDDFRVVQVDPATMEVVTQSGARIKAAVANIIPPQMAGDIAHVAGCADGAWCPIDPHNFASAKVKDIYVLGDSAIAAEMPKSAFSASSQGKAVAADILAELAGAERFAARYRNTCWSLLAADDSIKIGASYKPAEKEGKPFLEASGGFVSQRGETAEVRKQNYLESVAWYHAFIADAFNDNTAMTHKG
jgi:NADPH-dependent 2,4-dienoyl-CoA reductase/sulfur reductase-like enzyme